MTKLKEISYTQNQKSAEKRHTFDFFPSLKHGKTINCQQIFQNNIFSKKEKGQFRLNEIDPNKQSFSLYNKKGGLLMN